MSWTLDCCARLYPVANDGVTREGQTVRNEIPGVKLEESVTPSLREDADAGVFSNEKGSALGGLSGRGAQDWSQVESVAQRIIATVPECWFLRRASSDFAADRA